MAWRAESRAAVREYQSSVRRNRVTAIAIASSISPASAAVSK
jgi:hypothetical protein